MVWTGLSRGVDCLGEKTPVARTLPPGFPSGPVPLEHQTAPPPTNTQIMLPVLLRSKESSHTYICRTQVTFFLGEGLCLCFPRI